MVALNLADDFLKQKSRDGRDSNPGFEARSLLIGSGVLRDREAAALVAAR
jgi:hypothetical protein